MTVIAKRLGKPIRHGNTPRASAFRNREIPFPFRALHTQLLPGEIDILPLKRHHLSAPQSRLASKENNDMCLCVAAFAASTKLPYLSKSWKSAVPGSNRK
jgi:hypothetical protein